MRRVGFRLWFFAILCSVAGWSLAQSAAKAGDPAKGSAEKVALKDWWPSLVVNGKVDTARYDAEAKKWNHDHIEYRLGPDYEYFHPGAAGSNDFREIWMTPRKYREPGKDDTIYQLAVNPKKEAGNYFSTQGQLAFVPDSRGNPGVDRVFTLCWSYDVGRTEPFYWANTGTEIGARDLPGDRGDLLDVARACNGGGCHQPYDGLMLFGGHLVCVGGNLTSHSSHPKLVFPPEKLVTSMALSSRNEFALFTVWDLKERKGQVAVAAISSWHKDGLLAIWDWFEPYPGLPNFGSITGIKLLGYIDLPPAMVAPTGISVAGVTEGVQFFNTLDNKWINYKLGEIIKFSEQEWRDSFAKGNNRGTYSNAGFAVVISKYDKCAVFLDLQPLFEYYMTMYFTSQENFDLTRNKDAQAAINYLNSSQPRIARFEYAKAAPEESGKGGKSKQEPTVFKPKNPVPSAPKAAPGVDKVAALSKEDKTWPFTFAAVPEQMPKVIEVQALPNAPTAVITSRKRAWTIGDRGESRTPPEQWAAVATVDGTLQIFSVGGLGNANPYVKGDVKKKKAIPVGKNPCYLNYVKHVYKDSILVAARGDREVQFVRVTASGGEVFRRLRDKRLLDPVCVQEADHHGQSLNIISVCDFRGKQLINYRYTDIEIDGVLVPIGTGPEKEKDEKPPKAVFKPTTLDKKPKKGEEDKKAKEPEPIRDIYECEGVLSFPGKPFIICAGNVS